MDCEPYSISSQCRSDIGFGRYIHGRLGCCDGNSLCDKEGRSIWGQEAQPRGVRNGHQLVWGIADLSALALKRFGQEFNLKDFVQTLRRMRKWTALHALE